MPADSINRMDSSGSSSKNGASSDDALSSSPGTSSLRERTDSESSDKQARFILPSIDGSPPKVLTMDEFVNVVNNIKKMEIVHEIALNPEFKLQPQEPPENSLGKKIKETMHKAFWDILKEQLNRDPPCFDHAIQLLNDIKECLPEIIPANNQRTLDHINEILDTTIIKQQAEQGVLNFRSYADFIIQIMAISCAPIRDEQIAKLKEVDDVVETFKGILETMTVMKLDVTNCLLEFAKNDILANSIVYEKKRFREYLEYYKHGFPITETWLKRNQRENANGVKNTPEEAIYNAYMELLDWDDTNPFPEILSIDKERILKLSNRAVRLCVCASIMAIFSGVPIISQRQENRNNLANEIQILLQNVIDKDLKDALENIWLQVRTAINRKLEAEDQTPLDQQVESTLKAQILQLSNKDSVVRKLMWGRLKIYFRLVLHSKTGLPPPPPGYIEFKEEIESIITTFRRIITYNYSVFGDYYIEILTGNSETSTEEAAAGTSFQKSDENKNEHTETQLSQDK